MGIVDLIRNRGGVVLVSALTDVRLPRREVDRALARGALIRPRRGWLAVPSADAELIAAARGGVRLTCVTQARRLGLWVLDEERPHVAAPPHSGAVRVNGAHVHWERPPIQRVPGELVDPVENVLAVVAGCQPYEAALATWESAMRQRRVDPRELARHRLGPDARRLLADAAPFHDAGTETLVQVRLRWLGEPVVPQVHIAGHTVDFLIGERLVLQIDGGHHVGAQRDSDNEHDARLQLLGYHVIRVGYRQLVHEWPLVQALILRAIAQGLHRA